MAHFAKISEENVVLQVLTLADKDCQNEEGIETESVGQTYLETHNNWSAHLEEIMPMLVEHGILKIKYFGQKNLLEVGQKIQQLQNGSVQQEILLP